MASKVYLVFGGRYCTRMFAGKEVLGIEDMQAGTAVSTFISVEAIGRSLVVHASPGQPRAVGKRGHYPQLSLVPPRFSWDSDAEPPAPLLLVQAPKTPPRQPAAEDYGSPYTHGRNIRHRGSTVIDM